MRAVLQSFYAAKIEAVRRTASLRDRLAAIRVLHEDRRAALRALAFRRDMDKKAIRERQTTERRAAFEATRRQEADRPRDGPI